MPMARQTIVLDGLWRCLCPSVDTIALAKALQSSFIHPQYPTRVHATCQRRAATTLIRGQFHANNSQPSGEKSSRKGQLTLTRAQRYLLREWNRHGSLPLRWLNEQHHDDSSLDVVDTPTFITSLRQLLNSEGQYFAIANIVRYLVTKRGEKPNAFLYECLIRANIDPIHGSAEIVSQILKEIEKLGLPPSTGIFHGVLDVLAIHPDSGLQNKVLRDMKHAWISITPSGHLAITVGLLRDRQYEKALEKLEELHRDFIPIPVWLYDTFIYTFGELGHYEEALMILQHRLVRTTTKPSNNLWYFLLDVFSRDGFLQGIDYVWKRTVTSGIVNPPDGTIVNILNAASRNGSIALATDAIKVLTKRGKKLGVQHFEPLLEIYAREGHLKSAFLALCLMRKAGQIPDSSSTRAIYRLLRGSESQLNASLAILHELTLNHLVPISAFNVVLEATLHHRGFKSGLDLYRSVRQICRKTGPDISTYNLLLSHCTLGWSLRFILAEMEASAIKPNEAGYDRIIRICTLQENYELAFRYLEILKAREAEVASSRWWISKDTALALIRRCMLSEDIRVRDVLADCRTRGMDIDSDVRTLAKKVKTEKKRRAAVAEEKVWREPEEKAAASTTVAESASG